MLRFFACSAFVALTAAACSNERGVSPIGVVKQANEGAVTTAHTYAVGVCLSASAPGSCARTCSGTLVAPNLVLTARHCVDQDTNPSDALACGVDSFTTRSTTPAQTFVTTNDKMNQATLGWHGVSQIRTPAINEACESDIALLVLADNVAATEANPADVLAFGTMTDHSRYSTEITLIGFGLHGPNEPGTSGQRRILEHVAVQCIVGDPIFDNSGFCKSGGMQTLPDGGPYDTLDDKANFLAGWGGCPGDSGSGAFEQTQFDKGVPLVMGVLSRSASEGSVCLQLAYTRTDHWKDFLIDGAKAAALAGGYALPAWAKGATVLPPDAGVDAPDGSEEPAPELGAKGAACVRPSDCASGACVAVEGREPKCADHCAEDRTCETGHVCLDLEGQAVCVAQTTASKDVVDERAESGCSVVGPRSARGAGAAAITIVIGALAAFARRRRSAR